MADNLSKQVEEVEALSSIYGRDWVIEDESHRSYSIQINEGEKHVVLYVKLPPDYPSDSPPVFQLSAPEFRSDVKQRIFVELNELYLENIGETIIFQWIERIREILQDIIPSSQAVDNEESRANENCVYQQTTDECSGSTSLASSEKSDIIHGNTITNRKSVFQGHATNVETVDQVKQKLKKLYENRKIANATHNIYAYRILKKETNSYIQDCEDDGENQAGSRLLHLLQILDVKNVLVVVSRWYGGVHLGPDRFRHINNAARQVLDDAGFLPMGDTGKKKKP